MKNLKLNIKKSVSLPALFSLVILLFGCTQNVQNTSETKITGKSEPPAVRVSAAEADAAEPAIAAATDGGAFVVWVEHAADKTANVFLQKFAADGKPAGEKTRVNPNIGAATAWRGDQPTIAVGADGAIFVGWTARVETESNRGNDLFLSVSRDGGKSFAAPVRVNDDKIPADRGMHSLAVGKDGKVFLAWLDERYLNEQKAANRLPSNFQFVKIHHEQKPTAKPAQHEEANREVYFAASTDGGKTFSPNKKIAAEACPCCKTAATTGTDGRIFVAWRQVLPDEFRHIAVASSIDGGANFGHPAIVSDDRWQLKGCPVSGASLAVNSENKLKIVWFSSGAAGAAGIYQSESNDGGKTFAPRILVSEGAAIGTPILRLNERNETNVVWDANGKLFSADEKQGSSANKEIGAGELPSAAIAGNRLFVAFVKKEGEKRAVWLSAQNKN